MGLRVLRESTKAIVANPEYPLKDDRLIIDVVKKGMGRMDLDHASAIGQFRQSSVIPIWLYRWADGVAFVGRNEFQVSGWI